jgi:uncharacterized protein YceK
MMRLILIIAACVALSACGSMRSTTSKTDLSTNREEAIKATTIETANTKTDKATLIVSTTTEKADTTIKVPGSIITSVKPLDAVLIEGLKAEDNGHRITVTFDPATKTLKATAERDDELHKVTIDKTTTTSTVVDESSTKEEAKSEILDVKASAETDLKTVDKQKERSGISLPWWLWLILIALVCLGLYKAAKRYVL